MRGVFLAAWVGAALVVAAARPAYAQVGTWADISPASAPSDRRSCGAAIVTGVTQAERMYIFGGFGSGSTAARFRGDLWYYDSADRNWHTATSTNPPSQRDRHALAYDPVAQRLVLFGGFFQTGPIAGQTYYGDLYIYDPTTGQWATPTMSVSRPTARIDARMHWSPQLGKLLLFAGQDGTQRFNELWTLSLDVAGNAATWNLLTPSGTAPSPRDAPCTVYDTTHEKLIVFGGETSVSVMVADTLSYDPVTNAWQPETVSGTPPSARAFCATAYDSQGMRMLLYGGQSGVDPISGTFAYNPATHVWGSVSLTSGDPGVREVGGAAYSVALGGMLNFGGRIATTTYVADTWLLTTCNPISTTDTTCDGVDDDCSGTADEDYQPVATSCGVGACAKTGVTSCSSGSVTDSCTPGLPLASTDTTCDGIDQDCSGGVDEDFVSVATTCGAGACLRAGALVCVSGASIDTCVPGSPLLGLLCCSASDCDDGDACTIDTCGVGGACAHAQGSCGPAPPDPCDGKPAPCESGILRVARGTASHAQQGRLGAAERAVLQLVLQNGAIAVRVPWVRVTLRTASADTGTVAWRLYDDADGDGHVDASAAPIAEGEGPRFAPAASDLTFAAGETRTLVLTARRLEPTTMAPWFGVLAAVPLLWRRRGRAVLLGVALTATLALEACSRTALLDAPQGVLLVESAMVAPMSADPTQYVSIDGLPVESQAIEL